MTETTAGREPVQIVELRQPRCGHSWSKGRCRAGSGRTADVFTTDWSSGTLENWTVANGTLTNMDKNGLRWRATSADTFIYSQKETTGFDGDTWRYAIVRGRYFGGTSPKWKMFYRSDLSAASWSPSRAMRPTNLTELQNLTPGDEFIAAFDATLATDYAATWQGAVIDRFRLDIDNSAAADFELYSLEIAEHNPLDRKHLACFNTLTTCDVENDYRGNPVGPLTATGHFLQGDTVLAADYTRIEDLFFAVDVEFSYDPSGVILELGGSGTGLYLGVSSGNLVLRAGSGSTGHPSTCAKVSEAVTPYIGKKVTLYGAVFFNEDTVTLWAYDPIRRTVTEVGTDTAVSSWTQWRGTGDGGVGTVNGTAPDEDVTDFDGVINYCDMFNKTTAPAMPDEFAQSLYFSRGNAADREVDGAAYIIPSLKSVSTSPTKINLAGSDTNSQGLGNRALCTISFDDHPHTDRVVDPYVDDRDYDPYQRSMFWRKFIARDKYVTGMLVARYEGYAGQALSAMRQRQYFLDSLSGPNGRNGITIKAKDILARLEDRKAQAPVASPGELYADIADTDMTFEIAGALLSEYPASGTLRIGDELLTYSAIAETANGLEVTVTARGTDGSEASDHDATASVQECLRYTDAEPYVILRDLLNRAGVSYSVMDYDNWQEEVDNYLPSYNLTTLVSKPTAITKLVSDIQEQSLLYIWWDEVDQLIKLRSVRGVGTPPDVLTDEKHIIADTFSITTKPKSRVSQVWVNYNPRDWTKSFTDDNTWENLFISADLASEDDDHHGEPSVRKIYGQWLPTGAMAENTASKIITRYVDIPRVAEWQMDAKDRDSYRVGDTVQIDTHHDVDAYGVNRGTYWTITSTEEVVPGERVRYTAEDTTLYGLIYKIQASGAADYVAGQEVGHQCFIGDANGFLSDGVPCGRIA